MITFVKSPPGQLRGRYPDLGSSSFKISPGWAARFNIGSSFPSMVIRYLDIGRLPPTASQCAKNVVCLIQINVGSP